jgi:hypothetical protein
MKLALTISALFFFISCNWNIKSRLPFEPIDYSKKVFGWKPTYAADTSVKKIKYFNTPRPMSIAGKIYVFGNTIFQNDLGKGIHLIDNSNPATAKRVAFIELMGNTDIAIKGNYLYANNYNDLVVLDISDVTALKEVKRFKWAFNTLDVQRPYPWVAPPDTGYYECPRFNNDSIIVSWAKDSVYKYCLR